MKKLILLTTIILISFLTTRGQNLTLSNDDGNVSNGTEITVSGALGPLLTCPMYVTNNGTSSINVKVRKKINFLVPGAEATFCWAGSCWGADVFVSDDYVAINAGETNNSSFVGEYDPKGFEGTSYVMYTFFDMNSPNDSVSFVAKYVVMPASISDIHENLYISSAYPNPSDKSTYINYIFPFAGYQNSIVLHDMMGNEVLKFQLIEKKGNVRIDTYQLPEGIYFYSVIIENNIYYTKKLVVSHK